MVEKPLANVIKNKTQKTSSTKLKKEMEEVDKLFGKLQMHCVGTFKVQAAGDTQEAFLAQINNGTTDRIVAIALGPVSGNKCVMQPLSQVKWHSLTVRSFASSEGVASVLKTLGVPMENLPVSQKLTAVNWGDAEDYLLTAAKSDKTSKTYTSNIPYVVTLHSTSKDNKYGNELETKIELIPALQTMNFTLVKK